MQAISCFTLEKHRGPYEYWPRCSRLFKDGRDTGIAIPGYIIEAQYACSAGYLLITSHDCPSEEANDFLLLSEDFKLLARHDLAAMYRTFLLQSHSAEGDHRLILDYQNGLRLVLKLSKGWFGLRWRLRLQRMSAGD